MLSQAYEYVCAVEHYRNVSKAADSLCITQSALTKYLNRLERSLGVQLFNRSVSPVTLTPAGLIFVEKGHTILDMERELLAELNRLSDSPRYTLAIGITNELYSAFMPYILPDFYGTHPGIQLQITEGNNALLLEALRNRQIEFALMASVSDTDNLILESVQTEMILLAVPAGHPVAASRDLAFNSPLTPYYLEPECVRGADFIVCSPELGMGTFADNMFRKYRLEPNIVLKVQRNEAALRLASTGAGIVFTPVKTALRLSLQRPMAYFSIENPVSTRLRCLCRNKDYSLSEAAKCFISVLQKCLLDEPELQQPICRLICRDT